MNERTEKKRGGSRRKGALVLLILSAILFLGAAVGYILRNTASEKANLDKMRMSAVLHAASEGLVDKIAQDARADKLSELRKDKNFRKRGLDEVNEICDTAMEEARAEAEQKYSNPVVEDETALEGAIEDFEAVISVSGKLEDQEKENYAQLYEKLTSSVSDWTELVGAEAGEAFTDTAAEGSDTAAEGSDAAAEDNESAAEDDQLEAAILDLVPELQDAENAHLVPGFVQMAKDMAQKELEQDAEETTGQLISQMQGEIPDWTVYEGLSDEELLERLAEDVPDVFENEAYQEALLESAKASIEAAAAGGAAAEEANEEAAIDESAEPAIDYTYFIPSESLEAEQEQNQGSFAALMEQLVVIIPDLGGLSDKLQDTLKTNLEHVVWPGGTSFAQRYDAYSAHGGLDALSRGQALKIRLAAMAQTLLLAGIALLLMALVMFNWETLTGYLGIPRTIITLFFLLLCLVAPLYRINVPMMLGNVLERMTMYGVLVLAMMPGIQCGIGLNMGMTIGCIAGLLGIVLSLQFNMIGFAALVFACVSGAVISLPLGWGYSKLLNRMKGNEMTISTYVGFSFVSLMCIGWMLLPFNNPKIIWLLSGRGLRVTHSLLGSFAHLLDNFLAFEIFGVDVPTGGLLFLAVCCLLVWIFSRSRTGVAMTAAGSNPHFAEASGINVNHMRTIGTVLSTVIAAVGIVIYSQAFGYAQLYTAPRQLGFIAASAILIGGATVSKARVSHVIIGVFLFEGVLVFGQQIANAAVAGGGLSEVMRIMISNGIILYALTQSGGGERG